MRSYILPLLLLLTACGGRKEEPSNATAVNESPAQQSPAAPSDVQYFRGTVNNKIPVVLWLRTDDRDSILEGAVTYTAGKSKQPIRLLGNLVGPDRVINEYLPDGQISGVWAGKMTSDGFNGIWSTPASDKEYKFVLQRFDTAASHIPGMQATTNITGSYAYNYPKQEAMGSLNVRLLDPSHIVCNIDANIGAPSYNMAMTGEDTLELKGNTAVRYSSDEYGSCRYRIRFFRDFAAIDYPTGEYECGFGHNASVEGLFIKTGNQYQKSMNEDL